LCLAAHAENPIGDRAFGWACDELFDNQEWVYNWVDRSLHIQWPGGALPERCLDVDTLNYTEVQTWNCLGGVPNQQWQFRRVMLRGYGGLCLTRPATGRGPVTMQECDGLDTQLWRIEPGSQWASVRFKSEVGYTCLAARGGSGDPVVAETCSDAYAVFLPLVQRGSGGGRPASGAVADPAPREVLAGGQDFYLLEGGKIWLSTVAGGPSYCFDVHDVWNSQFTSGQGGPRPGQRVQIFDCHDDQLNQRWNLTGDIVSVNKCLTLSGDNTANGAPASVSRCDGSLNQDWDYYW
jgi:hypothetical protein